MSLCKPALSHILVRDRPRAKQLSTLQVKMLAILCFWTERSFISLHSYHYESLETEGIKPEQFLDFEALQEAGLGKITSYKPKRGAALDTKNGTT